MKEKWGFGIGFEVTKRRKINTAIAFVVMAALCLYGQVPIWVAPLCAAAYFVFKCVKLKLPEKANYIWLIAEVTGLSFFTEWLIQFSLLDKELREKTTAAKTMLNVLICMAIYAAFLVVWTNVVKSLMTAFICMISFAGVDYFVYLFRGNELIFADLKSFKTGLSVLSEYKFSLSQNATITILLSIITVAFIRMIRLEFERRFVLRGVCLFAVILCAVRVANKVEGVNTESWEQKGTYRNGYLLNFVLSIRDSFVEKPENYSTEKVAEIESRYESADTEIDLENAPTIIAIMDESFADLSVIGDLHTNEEVMPYISSMSENVIKGYALSSVFGAKTPNSEWEFLTGNTMAFLPSGSVVYQQYMNENPYSVVTALRNYGYTCISMHPYYETGWSRNSVHPKLGFTESLFLDDFPQQDIVRSYVSDQEMFDQIIEMYENREDGEKQFIFGITMQNHGGYREKYDNFTENIHMTNGLYEDVNQYLSLANLTDQAVENLISYFESVDEDVIICFFGDHQPSLQNLFYRSLNGKGLSGLSLEELENLFKVPFFIWTNYDTETEKVECTSLNFLSSMMMERSGLPIPDYNQFLLELQETVPALNARGYYSLENHAFTHYADATGTEEKALEEYQILQYNAMFDDKNRNEEMFPLIRATD